MAKLPTAVTDSNGRDWNPHQFGHKDGYIHPLADCQWRLAWWTARRMADGDTSTGVGGMRNWAKYIERHYGQG